MSLIMSLICPYMSRPAENWHLFSKVVPLA
jgi:hypothetical protein